MTFRQTRDVTITSQKNRDSTTAPHRAGAESLEQEEKAVYDVMEEFIDAEQDPADDVGVPVILLKSDGYKRGNWNSRKVLVRG